jgi:hypothetical protein
MSFGVYASKTKTGNAESVHVMAASRLGFRERDEKIGLGKSLIDTDDSTYVQEQF